MTAIIIFTVLYTVGLTYFTKVSISDLSDEGAKRFFSGMLCILISLILGILIGHYTIQ